jgi:LPS-assembly lipoprotein
VKRALAAIMVAGLLAGCGWHLRGWQIGGHVDSAHVAAGAASFIAAPLKQALESAGVDTGQGAGASAATIRLIDQRVDRRNASVGSGARAAEAETTLAVEFAIDAAGQEIAAPRWIQGTRILSIDRNSIAGSAQEQSLIEQEIRADLVQQIMRSLSIAFEQQEGAGAG